MVSSCAIKPDLINKNVKAQVKSEAVVKVVEVIEKTPRPELPKLPAYCGQRVKSGTTTQDRIDIAFALERNAKVKANDRLVSCNNAYEKIRKAQ